MAPEQIEGHPRAASDQYALGVVVYEWLCGEAALPGLDEGADRPALEPASSALAGACLDHPSQGREGRTQGLGQDPRQRFGRVQDFALACKQPADRKPSLTKLLPSKSQHLQKLGTPIHNLPAQLTSLIGREQRWSSLYPPASPGCPSLDSHWHRWCRQTRRTPGRHRAPGGLSRWRLFRPVGTDQRSRFGHAHHRSGARSQRDTSAIPP